MARSENKPASDSTVARPRVVGGVVLAGLLIGFLPFALSWWVTEDFGAWEVILSTTLTNVGTTLLLAAVLFFVQRSFTATVRTTVSEAATREVAAQTADIRETTSSLQMQISEIAQELERRRKARAQGRDSVTERARSTTSFDAVADLLEAAADLGCLWRGYVVVPAGSDFRSPRVQVFWGEDSGRQFLSGNIFEDADPAIVLSYEVPLSEQRGGSHMVARAAWRPGMSPADALDELITSMQRVGYAGAASDVRPDLFDQLATALHEAMLARSEPSQAWIRGRLYEWLIDGWAITDEGLENREGHGLAKEVFPDPGLDALAAGRRTPVKRFEPASPAGVDPDFWELAIERSRPNFGRRRAPTAASDHGAVPYTPETSPRQQFR